MKIIEHFLQSKKSFIPDHGGEDGIVVTTEIAAVIDGATAKTATLYEYEGDRISPGVLAMRLLKAAVTQLDPDMTGREICLALNNALRDYYVRHDLLETVRDNPVERATAAVVLYNARQHSLMLAGDCQAVIFDMDGATHHQNHNAMEALNIQARVGEIERLLAMGELTLADFLAMSPDQDPGRHYILNPPTGATFPGLTGQSRHHNNPHSPFASFALDGFASLDLPGFAVIDVSPTATQIVLASDGYPADAINGQAAACLRDLATAEAHLAMLITNDPQCFRLNKGTKGKGLNASFDDRAYLRLTLWNGLTDKN